MKKQIKQGDFTELAKNYVHRVGYSKLILDNLASFIKLSDQSIIADVAAGTGKLTENLLHYPCKKILCVEPNDAMREEGIRYIQNDKTRWFKGSGEITTLGNEEVNWVTVGSAFHWMETETALKEFHRILKPGGFFTAIWNPRNIQGNPLHEQIENKIYELAPFIERKSSGSGKFTDNLDLKIIGTGQFKDVLYQEARHEEKMSKDRYLGIWDSVNDIPAQTGPDLWAKIITQIKKIIAPYEEIVVPYKTRSWTARKI